MNTLEISTRPDGPRLYSLEAEEVRVTMGKSRKIELRVPYWDISPRYTRHTRPKEKTASLIAKMAIWAVLPFWCSYYAVTETGFFWVFVLLMLIPIVIGIRKIGLPSVDVIIFNEDIDGGWAFDIIFEQKDEARVLSFVSEVQKRLEAFAERRRSQAKEACGDSENDEEA